MKILEQLALAETVIKEARDFVKKHGPKVNDQGWMKDPAASLAHAIWDYDDSWEPEEEGDDVPESR